ncbi:hypothetical protein PIROE2DRAFT_3184 [Piromyces sp. E2]|nr:hypothetical protein PIROE2DRAFT_3184 [Piromyces sp. E2]|eukprot:OUM68956.1 hypothetical protein PIROE2DRAFT_3184 [Piromyces sp. E2]
MTETRKSKNSVNKDDVNVTNNKKRELNEEEDLNLVKNKKRKFNDNNEINTKAESSEVNEIVQKDIQKSKSVKETSSATNSKANKNKSEKIEMEIDNNTNCINIDTDNEFVEETNKESNSEKVDISKEDSNSNKTNDKEKDTTIIVEIIDKKLDKEEDKTNTIPSKSKPTVRKSKRLIAKNTDISTGDNSTKKSKDTTSPTTTITKRKRMNADQDLITHQEIDNAENLGSKNALEIIKKVIGNSVEDVELVVGAQLPVLVQPDTDRMKYQLGEIITIKRKSEIVKETQDKNETETEDKKKAKKIKGKKGRSSKEDGKTNEIDTISEGDQSTEIVPDNENNKENNDEKKNEKNISSDEVEMKVDQNTEMNKEKEDDKDDEKMYYIHFINQDKRLDNWRREEDLWTNKKYPEISNDASETTVRTTPYLYIPDDKAKLTRSMKRKYGIINESLQV